MNERVAAGGHLPSPQQELLLRAALLPNRDAVSAWEAWIRQADIEQLDAGSHRLLPLLYRNLQTLGVTDARLAKFRGVHRNTWYRNQLTFHAMTEILRAFHRAGIRTLVLKGAALIQQYYKDPGLRPMLDIDVLVPLTQVETATQLLTEMGWTPKRQVPHARNFKAGAEREFDLHWHVLIECCQADADDDFWQAATPIVIGDEPTLALNASDQLLHTCIHGNAWNPMPPVRWIADAAMILNTTSIDWTRVVVQTKKRQLALPMREALHYLRRLLALPIPPAVLSELDSVSITRAERWDYAGKIIAPEMRGVRLAFWVYWRDYLRSMEGKSITRKLTHWLVYLRDLWGAQHIRQVPLLAIAGIIRRMTRK